ncbi:DUF6666 family protein [Botrimarina sp.]|uniref:DUF6666 family protein n=1 Tax=Botrimarina sp. TaxID=2795802 RepID=UPI0032ED3D54
MRRPMLALIALTALCGSLIAEPAAAQLQWQSAGVRQVSHSEPTAGPALRPKAPKVYAQGASQPAPAAPAARQAAAPAPPKPFASQAAARTAPSARVDSAVQPACGVCGCVGGCDCGPIIEEPGYPIVEPGCGVVDPGCGFADPSCGIAYGDPCGCGDVGCVGGCGAEVGCGCGDIACGGCVKSVPLMIYVPPIRELTLYGGVQAYKNALDLGRDRGNFGFHQGINVGGAMSWLGLPGVGYQVGYRATQSQLNGDATTGDSSSHTQQFLTAGLFHRKPVGLQYGVVYDLLQDERQQSVDFGQIRGLVSVTNPRGHEIGFHFARHMNSEVLGQGQTFHSVDQYLAFYRKHGARGGECRLYGGFDDDEKGIVGADFSIPLDERWSLRTGFTYLIPEDSNGGSGAADEAWNLGTTLVWHYGCRARKSYHAPFRPMFEVADNGSMIIDDRVE